MTDILPAARVAEIEAWYQDTDPGGHDRIWEVLASHAAQAAEIERLRKENAALERDKNRTHELVDEACNRGIEEHEKAKRLAAALERKDAKLQECRAVIRRMVELHVDADCIEDVRKWAEGATQYCPAIPTQLWARHRELCQAVLAALADAPAEPAAGSYLRSDAERQALGQDVLNLQSKLKLKNAEVSSLESQNREMRELLESVAPFGCMMGSGLHRSIKAWLSAHPSQENTP